MEFDFMFLGFQFFFYFDQGKRCDLLDCGIVEDILWKIFEGCWYFFYFICLNVVDVCFICRFGIEFVIKFLVIIVNKFIFFKDNVYCFDENGDIGEMEIVVVDDDDDNIGYNGDSDDVCLIFLVNVNVD